MKKFFTKEGKPVEIGKPFTYSEANDGLSFNYSISNLSFDMAEVLEKHGFITSKEVSEYNINDFIDRIVDNIIRKLPFVKSIFMAVFNDIREAYPGAALNILIKECALELDKKYTDNIRNCDKLYGISIVDGTIVEVKTSKIKSFESCGYFRTLEDAAFACKVLKLILKSTFSSVK